MLLNKLCFINQIKFQAFETLNQKKRDYYFETFFSLELKGLDRFN